MQQPLFRPLIGIFLGLMSLGTGTIAANAQSVEPQVLAVQLDQMQNELQFLRRQVDTTSGGQDFEALSGKVGALEVSLAALEAKVARLIELDSRKSRRLDLLEQQLIDLRSNQSTGTTIASDDSPSQQSSAPTVTSTPAQIDSAPIPAPIPQALATQTEGGEDLDDAEGGSATQTARQDDAIDSDKTQVESLPLSASAIMAGALLNPGPEVPIQYENGQGRFERPIPMSRPKKDLDPQPLSATAFETLLREANVEGAGNDTPGVSAVEDSVEGAAPEPAEDVAPATAATSAPVSVSAPAATPAPNASPSLDPARSSDPQVQSRYDAAYALVEAGDLAGAEAAFKAFLTLYPDEPLASNASYWLGESFYGRGMFSDSLRAFAGSVRDYRTGRKAPDALLKLGITLAILDQETEACRLLSFLPREYPDAGEALLARAQAETRKLNCS